ncbi:MAG TPA: hypothetical protein VFT67_14150 [Jatrophihabitantaceae bacterium]|jgi:hypothetical protein|nr:hypothetical protein [Jatrophihabitantaceae bacterium]
MPDLSPEAKARAVRTIDVAAVFADNAEIILAELPELPDGHVLVALVDADHAFTGTHYVEKANLVERIPQIEGDGWAMVFSPGASVEDVRRRTAEMADIARARIAAIDRILARKAR